MAKASVPSGSIQTGDWYEVNGTGSVIYSGNTYTNGQRFIGQSGVATYSITGTVQVWQVLTFQSLSVESVVRASEIRYAENVVLSGLSVETAVKANEIRYSENILFQGLSVSFEPKPAFPERTTFQGLSVELEDTLNSSKIIWFS